LVSTNAFRFQAIRRRAVSIAFVFSGMILPVGCGESGIRESTLPPPEFVEKLEKEHPELFLEKVGKGKKTEQIGGRARRAIIREQYAKSLQQGTQ
jgi:hypothetical protein